MRAVDGTSFTLLTTTTTATFSLAGGLYGIDSFIQGGGSVTLQKLAGDAVHYVNAAAANTAAAPYQTTYVPAGTFQFVGAAVTSYTVIRRIPSE